jgi:hypothetical protein
MRLKEWQRTIILVVLLAIAIGFILWTRKSVDTNFIDQF